MTHLEIQTVIYSRVAVPATSSVWSLIYKFYSKTKRAVVIRSNLDSYPVLHQLSVNESPVKIGPAVPKLNRNKQTDKQTKIVR